MRRLLFAGLLLSMPAYAASADRSVNDESIERAAEKLIAEGAKLEEVSAKASDEKSGEAKSEEETPVVFAEPAATKAGTSIVWRLLASVIVLAVAGAGLTYASRRWTRRPNVGGQQTRIEMMHQFHLGPRKSLALVRVAGETMLLGVTEQNINMLKSITLIDADMEAALNQDFNTFLDDEFSVADVNQVVGRRA